MKSNHSQMMAIAICFGLLNLISCSGGSESTPAPIPVILEVSNVSVMDVSNYGDGRDLQVGFSAISSDALSEYRIIVVKETQSSEFDLEAALNINAGNYTAISPADHQPQITLGETSKDSDGDLIVVDIAYKVFVVAIASDENTNATSGIKESNSITLENTFIELVVSEVIVSDVSNLGDGRDLEVSFEEITNNDLQEYRVIAVKESNANTFTLESAEALPEANYLSVLPENYESKVTFGKSGLDSDGDLIAEGEAYLVFVATVVAEASMTHEGGITSSTTITLSQTNLVTSIADGFSASGGIVVGSDGSIYVADFGTGTSNGNSILKFNASGVLDGTFATGLLGPTGGAFDSNRNLYWSSYSASKVHKIDASGSVTDFVDIPGPVAIAVDDTDHLFIASCDGNDIKKVSPEGEVTTFATSSSFNCINGLTITENGELYGCNFEDGNIFKITTDGTVSSFATIPSGSSVNMTYQNGFLYVTGRNAHRIYVVSTETGTIETLAGTGTRGNTDGAALDAEFSFPNGIKFNNEGTIIYVNDVDPTSNGFNPNILRAIELID